MMRSGVLTFLYQADECHLAVSVDTSSQRPVLTVVHCCGPAA